MRIRDIALKTCQRWWTIERSDERESGISMLAARHDDDKYSFLFPQLNAKTVLFQTIQFSIRRQFSSIWPTDKTLSGATIPDQSGPGSYSNERVLCIPKSFSITGTSMFSVISRTLVEGGFYCSKAVGIFYSPSQLGNMGTMASIYHYLWYSTVPFVSDIIMVDTSNKVLTIVRHYFKLSCKTADAAFKIWEV